MILDPSLFVKLAATAGLVLIATLIAEKAGAFFGAMIAALPLSAGPAYLFLAMEHDAAFLAQSALTGLGINTMICPFLVISAVLIRRSGLVVGLGTGVVVWALGSYTIMQAAIPTLGAIALNLVSITICLVLARNYLEADITAKTQSGLIDIILRVTAVVSVAAGVIIAGRLIGPETAGFVAVIPIVWMSMATVLYMRTGRRTTSAVLANGVGGMFGFCLALSALRITVIPLGETAALSIALFACVAWNLGLTFARPYIPYYAAKPTS